MDVVKKLPPQSLESEQNFLGALLMRPAGLDDVIGVTTPKEFYHHKHRLIFEAILGLHTKNQPFDIETVRDRLNNEGNLSVVGGVEYLVTLAVEVAAASNVVAYAHIIHQKYVLRSLADAGASITSMSFEEAADLDEVLERADKALYEVTNAPTQAKFLPLSNSIDEALIRLKKLKETQEDIRGVKTGFRDLDQLLSGLQKSDLIILAARPSMGKTSLALDIARQTATLHNTTVGIFSLEMSSQQLVDRMVGAETVTKSWNIRTGKVKDEEMGEVNAVYEKLRNSPIYLSDDCGAGILKMRALARKLKKESNLGLIVVDYLQLMTPSRPSDSTVQQVTEISRSLKQLARELDVPVLALSQLSRAVEQRGGKPRLSDLRDSGSIEQDADVVMFIHRDDKVNKESERPNIAEILVEKHRNGPTGKVELLFDEEHITFKSLSQDLSF